MNIRPQGGEDEVMVDAGEEVVMTGQDEQVVGVNADMDGVRIKARDHVHNVRPLTTKKKSE